MNIEIQLCEVRDVSPTALARFQASPWFVRGESHTTNELLMLHGHPRTILLAQCCYNADILQHIEDYSHFAEASPRLAAALPTFHNVELLPNMQFYAARRSRIELQLREHHPMLRRIALESRSIRFCRGLFNPDTE